jgi:hypothetical protein
MNPGPIRFCIWVILGAVVFVIVGCNAVVIFGDGSKGHLNIPETHTIKQGEGTNKALMNDTEIKL